MEQIETRKGYEWADYVEIYQDNPTQFSVGVLKDGHIRIVAEPFLCRDYLSDVLWSIYKQDRVGIYGFYFDAREYDIVNPSQVYVTLHLANDCSFGDEELASLNELEDMYGIENTVCLKSSTDDDVFVFEPGSLWMQSTQGLSAFSLIIRALTYKHIKTVEDWVKAGDCGKASEYLAKITPQNFHIFLDNIDKFTIDMNETGEDVESAYVHDYGGVLTIAAVYRELGEPYTDAHRLGIELFKLVDPDLDHEEDECHLSALY